MINVTTWIAYNTAGDHFASVDGASEALEGLLDNYGADEGTRVVEMALELPDIKPLAVSAVIPETDGPVTVTVNT